MSLLQAVHVTPSSSSRRRRRGEGTCCYTTGNLAMRNAHPDWVDCKQCHNPYGRPDGALSCVGTSRACYKECASVWAAWGACSATCGAGMRTRVRTVTEVPAGTGGKQCDDLVVGTKTQETAACNVKECPVDCQLSQWTAW